MGFNRHTIAQREGDTSKGRPVLALSLRTARAVLGLTILCLVDTGPPAWAQEPKGEYVLKTAFLYNIAKFVEWPDGVSPKSSDPLTLCVAGDAFGSSIDSLEGKEVRGHPITIRKNVSRSSIKTCHVLFFSNEEVPGLAAALNDLKNSAVLTVCDSPGCAERGLMINLRLIDNKVSIEVNLEAIQRTPLKVSSQLLKLARLVKNERDNP